jgi:hypothetical protein
MEATCCGTLIRLAQRDDISCMPLPYDIKINTEQPYWRAFDFLEGAARVVAPGVTTTRVDDVNLAIDRDEKRVIITTFGHAQLSDLENGLSDTKMPTPYVGGLKADAGIHCRFATARNTCSQTHRLAAEVTKRVLSG